jgi:hypothetical protein
MDRPKRCRVNRGVEEARQLPTAPGAAIVELLMYDLKAALLSAALSLPPPWYPPGENPETLEQYRARVDVIASAISTEANQAPGWGWGSRALAFAALTIMYNESGFALSVHTGEKLGDRGRASCLGQVHMSGMVPKHEWARLTGVDTESTRRCARATIRYLVAQHRGCKLHTRPLDLSNMARVFTAYATGGSCVPGKVGLIRAREWNKLMTRH